MTSEDENKIIEKKYDENGRIIFKRYENEYWEKYQYDSNGNRTYRENSEGYWEKCQYDENSRLVSKENSEEDFIYIF